ncbi:LysE family transporter [Shewanella sp. 1_MG-2023]|uniref:LysE family translocator n=1 Tax=unclassified Shewanella TaxID=196818 RepID=UPI0026E151C8|nr:MULTISPECIES: LysE family transporter [unclassified Shewanella]MDO6612140.1 LysE family transporter [Shewanella sp. 7_MG-2023]MDO6771994.1 LysE family transporter [Shewanella sp. 2_MG-2023]MDO6796478.1 LysE family transporter [Shewanella sp. 1_MG-2023]
MDFALLSTLAVIHCLALVSPGPDFAIIVKTSTQQTRQTALMCAFGISIAILVHSLLSLLGISLMIQQSEMAYLAVQIIGISYLAYMGFGALNSVLKSFKTHSNPSSANNNAVGEDVAEANLEPNITKNVKSNIEKANTKKSKVSTESFNVLTPAKGFRLGLYTNMLNPKALIFFITIFTVLVTPQVTTETKVAAASLLFILSLFWFSFLAIVLTKPVIQQKMAKGSRLIDAITGVIFMGVAITILVSLLNDYLA